MDLLSPAVHTRPGVGAVRVSWREIGRRGPGALHRRSGGTPRGRGRGPRSLQSHKDHAPVGHLEDELSDC